MLYSFRGSGGGADRVISCVSVRVSGFVVVDTLVDWAVIAMGAKTVRYGVAWVVSSRAKGLVGEADV